MGYENEDLMTNLKATELRLGLPGQHETDDDMFTNIINNKKRQLSPSSSETNIEKKMSKKSDNNNIVISNNNGDNDKSHQQEETAPPPPKAQIVGWPPVGAYRKNSLVSQTQKSSNISSEAEVSGMFVKVSMDGAPYLRKIDIRVYQNYPQLLKALEALFKFTIGEYSEREGYKGSDYVPTYEDKDGDWMLVGDVPWDMFMSSCKRMRIMRESEARGLGCGL